jgi:hypothetical protein
MNLWLLDDMYAYYLPHGSVLWSSVTQTVDGDLRVHAPGFRSSASPLLGATPRAHQGCPYGICGGRSGTDQVVSMTLGFFFS